MKLTTTARAAESIRTIEVEGADYDTLKAQVDAQLVEGEQLLNYRVDRSDQWSNA